MQQLSAVLWISDTVEDGMRARLDRYRSLWNENGYPARQHIFVVFSVTTAGSVFATRSSHRIHPAEYRRGEELMCSFIPDIKRSYG
jgi:hypothetical protein